jgi:hypothetical protein
MEEKMVYITFTTTLVVENENVSAYTTMIAEYALSWVIHPIQSILETLSGV